MSKRAVLMGYLRSICSPSLGSIQNHGPGGFSRQWFSANPCSYRLYTTGLHDGDFPPNSSFDDFAGQYGQYDWTGSEGEPEDGTGPKFQGLMLQPSFSRIIVSRRWVEHVHVSDSRLVSCSTLP